MGEADTTPGLPSGHWRIVLAVLRRVPQAGLSRLLGRLADLRLPRPLRRFVLGSFARAAGVRLSEIERPLDEYPSLNAFFVRRLRPGIRVWPGDPAVAGSPVDGIVGSVGTIHDGTAVQAKGRSYSVAALLGDAKEAAVYEGGHFVTLYLSPRHYHRVHAPAGGTIARARHVPGRLFPVNSPSVAHVQDLFAINERVLCQIESELGRIALIAVGAFNVARISTAFDPDWAGSSGWVSNRRDAPESERAYDPPLLVARGSELMAFHLGSTVILLFPRGCNVISETCRPGREVHLGAPLVRAAARGDLSAHRPPTMARS